MESNLAHDGVPDRGNAAGAMTQRCSTPPAVALSTARSCRVPGCAAVLDTRFKAKYRVCHVHAHARVVQLDGEAQRFCQQVGGGCACGSCATRSRGPSSGSNPMPNCQPALNSATQRAPLPHAVLQVSPPAPV